jgi:hypothetical protein
MKYIVTESQYKRLVESNIQELKKIMFRYWDTQQEKLSKNFYKFFDINPYIDNNRDEVEELFLEWLGGIKKVYELIKNVEGNTMVAQGGTYNFRFKITNVEMGNKNTEVFYDVLIDGDGEVEINVGTDFEEEIIDNIYDGITNPDIGWEVKNEILDLIKEVVREKVVDYPCELSSFEVGNKRDF